MLLINKVAVSGLILISVVYPSYADPKLVLKVKNIEPQTLNIERLLTEPQISLGQAIQFNLSTPPIDHDKFLQFAESNTADTVDSANAYYQTVDPNNDRDTLNKWKALNGFIEPLPNTEEELAAIGIIIKGTLPFKWKKGCVIV